MGMVNSKYNMKHEGGGYYTITKKYGQHELVLQIHKTSTSYLLLYIYNSEKLQDIGFNEFGTIPRHMSYDVAKAEKVSSTFGINNLSEMKDYLNQMIGLWEEFTEKYIEKLKMGIEPPNTPYEDD